MHAVCVCWAGRGKEWSWGGCRTALPPVSPPLKSGELKHIATEQRGRQLIQLSLGESLQAELGWKLHCCSFLEGVGIQTNEVVVQLIFSTEQQP